MEELEGSDPQTYPYSSYQYYLGQKNANWIKPEEILGFFRSAQNISLKDCLSYQSFVEEFKENPELIIEGLTLE